MGGRGTQRRRKKGDASGASSGSSGSSKENRSVRNEVKNMRFDSQNKLKK